MTDMEHAVFAQGGALNLDEVHVPLEGPAVTPSTSDFPREVVDYVPGRQPTEKEREEYRKKYLAARRESHPGDEPVFTEPEDYLTPEESEGRRKENHDRVLQLAKSMYDGKALRAWEQAMATVQRATEAERLDPSPELKKAIRIVNKGKPLSKKKAKEEAARITAASRLSVREVAKIQAAAETHTAEDERVAELRAKLSGKKVKTDDEDAGRVHTSDAEDSTED